jgi:chromosome segregation ATPase
MMLTIPQLSEDVRKIGGSVTENLAKVDERLEKMEGTKKELTIKVADMEKASSGLGQEVASLTGLKSKAPAWDRKAETVEVDRLNSVLTEEVNRIQKEIKEIRKRNDDLQTEVTSGKAPAEPEVSQVQFKDLDMNLSRLSGIVETLQGRLSLQQDGAAEQLEQVNASIRGLKKGLETLSHESKQSGGVFPATLHVTPVQARWA